MGNFLQVLRFQGNHMMDTKQLVLFFMEKLPILILVLLVSLLGNLDLKRTITGNIGLYKVTLLLQKQLQLQDELAYGDYYLTEARLL
jgi:hypothetical protein